MIGEFTLPMILVAALVLAGWLMSIGDGDA